MMMNLSMMSAGRLVPVVRPSSSILFKSELESSVDVKQQHVRPYEEIPGPRPLPIIGNGWRFLPYIGTFGGLEAKDLFKQLHDRYGNIVKISNIPGRKDMLYIFHPQDFETVYRNEGQWPIRGSFASLAFYRRTLRRDFYKGIEGLGTSNGKEWQDIRSKLNATMMQPRSTKAYIVPIDEVAKDFIDMMRDLRDENGELPPDFINYIQRWALESISVVALDSRLGSLDRVFSPNSDAQRMINAARVFFNAIFELELKPNFKHFTKRKEWMNLVDSLDIINEISMKYVNKAMERIKQKVEIDERELSVLEALLLKNEDPMIGVVMSLDMMLAGIDTTSHSTATLLHYLARNQDKQEKLFQELKRILPSKDDPITAQKLGEMKYLKACIKESMRVGPTTGGNLRTTVKDNVLSNYRVPKEVEVMLVNSVAITKEEHFPQADRFIPERWLKGTEEYQKPNPFVFLPFGFGPRMCIGRRFAELEMETLTAKIIRNFRIEYHQELKLKCTVIYMIVSPLTFKLEDRE